MPESITGNLVWRCLQCKKDYPPTSSEYAGLIRRNEHKNHTIRLVDKISGEVMAKSLQEALKKGYIEKKEDISEEGVEVTEQGATMVPMRVLIPDYILTLFFYAKQNDLSDHANVIDFMVEYTQYGFMKAHNLGLTLAPVEVPPQGDGNQVMTAIAELRDIVNNLVEAKAKKQVKEE